MSVRSVILVLFFATSLVSNSWASTNIREIDSGSEPLATPFFNSTPINTGTQNATYTYNIEVIDGDGDPITLSAPVLPAWLSLTDNLDGTGQLTGTPSNNDVGLNNVTLEALANGETVQQIFTITVANVNDAPVLDFIGNQVVDEFATLSFTASAIDIDVPADQLTYSLDGASLALGMTINPGTGLFSWTPNETHGGNVYSVTLTVTDDGVPSLNDFETFDITVNETNEAPVLTSVSNQAVNETETLNLSITATDSDVPANTLTYSLDGVSTGLGMTIDPGTGSFSWTPGETLGGGVYSVTVTVTDNGSPSESDNISFDITVNDTNAPPVLDPIGNRSVDELVALNFSVTATDNDDPADNLTYSLDATSISNGMSINPSTGAFTWTPGEAQGGTVYSVTITVTDDGTPNQSDFETISITVNDVNTNPVLVPNGNKTVDEVANLNFTANASDSDLPADNLVFSLDATSISRGMTINPSTGEFDWTPTELQGGSAYSVTITVTDNGTPNLSDQETISITVNEINEAPVLPSISNQTIDELLTLAFPITATDVDIPVNTLNYSLDAASLSNGMTINPSTGAFSWTPTESQGGSIYNVTVTVTDNGSPNLSDNQSFQITVNEVNAPPVLQAIGNKSVSEETTLGFSAIGTDSDDPVNSLTYSLDATSISNGMSINASTGAFSWTPTELQGGAVYSATITVTDNGSPALNDAETIQITVNEINKSPVLSAIGNQSVNEFVNLSFTASATDLDLPADNLSFSLDGSSVSLGMSINPSTGEFTWTPGETNGGNVYSVTVTVTDDGSPVLTDAETFDITVNETNQAPVLNAVSNQNVNETELLNFTISATDPDIPTNNLTYSLDGTSTGLGMTINGSTGEFNWVPAENLGGGTYTVTVTVADDGSPSLNDNTSFDITVIDTNAPPVLDPVGDRNVDELTTLNFGVSASDSDDPVNTLTYSLDATSISRGMSINPSTGGFTWTPTETQGGSVYSVEITVTDNGTPTQTDVETINITVNDVNANPVLAFIGNQTVNEESILSFTVSATDSDIPVDNLTYSLDAASITLGMTLNPTTGAFSWTPTELQGGTSYDVTVTVTDDGSPNLADQETFSITVNEINKAPVLGAIGNRSVDEENLLTFTASATDDDLPANTLTYSLDATSLANGMSINPSSGAFIWTPSETQGGAVYSVTVTVTDNGAPNLSDNETIQITVNDINLAPVLQPIGNRSVDEESTLAFSALGIDTDDPVDVLSYSLDATSIANGMTINSSTGAFSWTPTEAQGGSVYTATITVTDNGTPSLNDQETIQITVNEVNRSPVLSAIGNQTVDEFTALNFTAVATDSDQPANGLTYTLDGTSIGLGMSINPTTGAFTWTPGETNGGSVYSVTITVTDDGIPNLSDAETIEITVNETNEAPVLNTVSNQVVNETESLNFTVSATDSDNPANSLTYSLDGVSTGLGMSIDGNSGAFSWTPAENLGGGVYNVTVTVTDDGSPSLSDNQLFSITVNDTNAPPVLSAIGDRTVDELNLLNFTASAIDTDQPVDVLTFTLGGGAPVGASISAGGVFNWTPSEAQGPGIYPVTIIVTDNGVGSLNDSETINITVNDVNTPPVLDPISDITDDEGSLITFTANATDTDLPANALTYSLAGVVPAGASINSTTGDFSWTPNESQGGSIYSIIVQVTDGNDNDFEIVNITVNEVNEAPVLNPVGNQSTDELVNLAFTVSAVDSDLPANTLTYSIDGAAQALGMSMTSGGNFSWTPTEAQGGSNYNVTITVTDNGVPTRTDDETIQITVNDINTPPVLDFVGNKTGSENNLISFTVTASDSDIPANTLTFSLGGSPPGDATINPTTGLFTWTPVEGDAANSPFTITIVVTDNGVGALSDSEVITINLNSVNQPPELTAISDQTLDELATLSFTAVASDPDIPADNLSFSLGGSPPSGASINSSTGAFTWTPAENQGGAVYPVTIIVTDDGVPNLDDNETFNVTVNDVNSPPVLSAIGNRSVDEQATLSFTALATDPDIPVNNLTFSIDGVAQAQGMSISPSGDFTWTPTEAQGGSSYPVTITVTDNGAGTLTDQETITITVNEVNTDPILGLIGNQSGDENSLLSFTVTASDNDLPANTLSYSLDPGFPTGASINPTTGVFSWTPTEAQGPGNYSVTIRVTDNGSPNLSDTETIDIAIGEVNVAPVLDAVSDQNVDELQTLSFTVTSSDADLPANDLTYSIDGSSIALGMSINPTTGLFTWTPSEAQGGSTYTVTVTVTDNGAGTLTDSDNFDITVADINTAPVLAAIGDRSGNELTNISFTASASDSDLPLNTLTYSLSGAPTGASINPTTGVFSWTPTESQGQGTYNLTIIVTDNGTPALSDNEAITITVNEVNTAPQLSTIGDQILDELTTLSFTANAVDADIPANTLTYSLDAGAPAGASINSTSGAFTWTPTEAQDGTFPITIRVSDDGGLEDFELINVTVNEINDAPVLASVGNQNITEGSLLTFTVSTTDSDIPVNALNYSLDPGFPSGASINSTTGTFTWTPSEAQGPGVYPVTIRVTDNGSPTLEDFETINITVTESNSPPVLASIGDQSGDELSTITFTASASDPDLPMNTMSYSLDAGAPTGASINSTTGVFTWIPSEGQGPGSYPVTVRVTDNGSPTLSDTETITISVNEVNQAPVLDPIGNRIVNEGNLISFFATATDADVPSNTLTFSLAPGFPSGASITGGGLFSWNPSEVQGPGVYPVTVIVSDNGNLTDSETFQILVNEVNTPPQLDPISDRSVNELELLTFTVTVNDPDIPANSLSFSLGPGAPVGATINASSGEFNWTPSENQGGQVYIVAVQVSDGLADDVEFFSITVNDVNRAPVLAAVGDRSVNELQNLSFSVNATDPDIPSNNLTFTIDAASQAEGMTMSSGGNFSWTPAEDKGGAVYTVTITVTDDGTPSLSDSEQINITVNDLNSAPVLDFIGDKSGDELTLITFTAEGTDSDIPANTLTYSLEGTPPVGASINSSTGVFTWTPNESQGPGIYSLTIRVTDNGTGNLSDSETFDITVNDVNSAPVLGSIGNLNGQELQLITFTAVATDSDIPVNTLSYSLSGSVPIGASINSNTGVFNWTPSESQGGANYTFGVKVSDGNLEDNEIITISVGDINEPPVLTAVGNKSINELQTLSFPVSAIDPDIPSNNLTFSIDGTAQALGMSITNGGVFSWTPTESQGGAVYPVTIRVTDDGTPLLFDEETIQITVNDINSPPALSFIGNQSVDELTLISFTASASDPDIPTDNLSFSLEGAPPTGASINSTTGEFTWTPSETQGPGLYSITVRVTDDGVGNLFDSETFDITVNDVNSPPNLDFIPDQSVDELNFLTFTATANDFDVPDNTLTFSLTGGAPAGASINNSTGVFTWTPTEAQGGQDYNFAVRVSDGDLSDTQFLTVTVNDINEPPVLVPIGDRSVNELATLTFNVSASDPDIPSNNLTFSIDATSFGLGMSITPGGTFSWTPSEDQGGATYDVTIRVRDNGTPIERDSETIQITVNDINTPPELDFIGNQIGDELTLITFTANATDTDLPTDNLTYSLGGTPPAGASINSNTGVFTWTPTEAQGAASPFFITVIVTDDGSPNLSDSETFQIFLNSVNVPPVLDPIGDRTVNERGTVSFTATASDSDIPANTLTFSLGNSPPAGTSIDPVTGDFTWTPTESQGGSVYPVTIVVTDDGDGNLSDSETIQITVNDVNSPPVLVFIPDVTINESELSTVNISATDQDIPADNLTYSLGGTPPSGAVINPVTGEFSWTPNETQGGTGYNFLVIVTDDGVGNLTDQEIFRVTVNEVNRPPILDPVGDKTVNELNTLNFAATASDPDIPIDNLTFTLTDNPPSGASINNSTGEFIWTPAEDQQGSYTFRINVSDGSETDSEVITVTVNDVNSPPVLNSIGNRSVDEGANLSFTVSASDSDIPADELSFSLGNTPPAGATIDPTTGVFSWTPGEDMGGMDHDITVVVTDNGAGNLSDLEVFTVTVNDVNSPPVLDPINDIVANEGLLIQFNAIANDPDIPLDNLSYSLLGSPPLGATIDAATGIFSWTPSEDQSDQTYFITIQVTDNGVGNLTDSETFQISVIGVNTPPVLDPIGNKIGDEQTLISFTVSASDTDIPQQSLTFVLKNTPPTGASLDPVTGLFEWTPTEAQGGFGPVDVTIEVTDGIQTDSETFQILVNEVNTAPSIASIPVQVINEEELFEYSVSVTDPDLPVNTHTFSFGGSIPTGLSIDPDSGLISWTPSEDQGPANYQFTVIVTDDGGLSNARNMTIQVEEVNIAPVLDPIGDQSVDELSLLTFQASASDVDIPVNNLTFSLDGAPVGASINSTTGLFTWTPSEAQGGADYTFDVVVSDGVAEDEETITVSVNDFNEAPVLNPIGDKVIDEQQRLQFAASATDSDVPVNDLTFSIDASSESAGMTITSNGLFTWTPTEAQGGASYTTTITVTDNGDPQLSHSETITITVNEINTPPVLEPIGSQNGRELELITFTAVASDQDEPADNLTFSLGSNPPAGAVIDPVTGVFTWTPTQAQGEVGIFTISIIVTDDGDPPLPDSEDVIFFINIVNEPPSFISTPVTTAVEGISYLYNINTFDPDISDVRTITGEIIPDWLTLEVDNVTGTGTLSGTPTNSDVGDHQVSLKVTDLIGAEAFQEFTITVNDASNPPILSTVFKVGQQGVRVNFESFDFEDVFEDIDGDIIEFIEIRSLPLNGALLLSDTVVLGQEIPLDSIHNLTYQPDPNFAGDDRFNWNAFDGVLFAQSDADVLISIAPSILVELLIYNTFTPNGDGDNDTWEIDITLDGELNETATISESFPGNTVKVFDINGNVVYSAVNYQNDWDGTVGGNDLPQGSYYYTIDLQNGVRYNGTVNIFR